MSAPYAVFSIRLILVPISIQLGSVLGLQILILASVAFFSLREVSWGQLSPHKERPGRPRVSQDRSRKHPWRHPRRPSMVPGWLLEPGGGQETPWSRQGAAQKPPRPSQDFDFGAF